MWFRFGGYDIYFDDICAGNYYASTLENIHNKVHQFLYHKTQHPNILILTLLYMYILYHIMRSILVFSLWFYRHKFFNRSHKFFPHTVTMSACLLYDTHIVALHFRFLCTWSSDTWVSNHMAFSMIIMLITLLQANYSKYSHSLYIHMSIAPHQLTSN